MNHRNTLFLSLLAVSLLLLFGGCNKNTQAEDTKTENGPATGDLDKKTQPADTKTENGPATGDLDKKTLPADAKTEDGLVTGNLDRASIQDVVNQHSNELRKCYEDELNKVKGLSGRIEVTWFIASDGKVANVVVSATTMHNQNVEDCLANTIKQWQFAAPKDEGTAKIVYPFNFVPSADSQPNEQEPVVTGSLDKNAIQKVVQV